MVRVQKTKKIEQPAVVTALLQDTADHTELHHIPQVMSQMVITSSQDITTIHNHSQSFTIQHYPTLFNIIQHYPTFAENSNGHSQKAMNPFVNASLILWIPGPPQWIPGGFPVPRAALPMDPSAKTVRKNRMSEESLRIRSNLIDFVQQNGGLMVV